MGRLCFDDCGNDGMLADGSSFTATSNTGLWNPIVFTRVPANSVKSGMAWKVTATGFITFNAGTTTFSLGVGVGVSPASFTSLGSSALVPPVGGGSNVPWYAEYLLVARSLTTPPTTFAFSGAGIFHSMGANTAGAGVSFSFGNSTPTFNTNVDWGPMLLAFYSGTAGSVVLKHVAMESFN